MNSNVGVASLDAVLDSATPPNAGQPDPDSEDSVESLEDALNRHDDEDGWEDVEEDTESITFISLFENKPFPDLQSMMEHDRREHGCDLVQIKRDLGLDFMESMKLVNYIRSEVKEGRGITAIRSKNAFADDRYLLPVLEDDSVLFNLEDSDEALNGNGVDPSVPQQTDAKEQEAFLREAEARPIGKNDTKKDSRPEDNDKSYFESYSFREIHEIMLKDRARTDAYRDFIYDSKQLFEGKTVLDIGCGTGILSMMCAKAGATRVFAVDNSAIIEKARVNVFVNKLDHKISCLHGKIEEVQLPVSQVDIIISEWMGYALLYEAMLDSVLFARDKWLHPEGLMVPSDIKLFIAPLADPELVMDKVSFWNDVYGFDMTSMQENICREPLIETTPLTTIASKLSKGSNEFVHFDLHKVAVQDLSFKRVPFMLELAAEIDALDGFVLWFDAIFNPSRNSGGDGAITLSTGPHAKDTHWHQVKLLINHLKRKPIPLTQDHSIRGNISYQKPKEYSRQLLVSVEWTVESGTETVVQIDQGNQVWHLE